MAYELFNKKRSHGGAPSITITRSRTIIINSSAVEEHFKPSHFVDLYWDPVEGRIGIKPVVTPNPCSYRLRYSGKVACLSAISFIKYTGYEALQKAVFPAVWNETKEILEIALA